MMAQTLRIFAVVLLCGFVIGASVFDFERLFGRPLGDSGFSVDDDAIVTAVQKGGAADRAGLRVGDRIDLTSLPADSRLRVKQRFTGKAGEPTTIAFERDGRTHSATISLAPEAKFHLPFIPARELVSIFFVGLGAFLVLRRPSVPTWAFFFFCLGSNPAPALIASSAGPFGAQIAFRVAQNAIADAAVVGALVFVLTFTRPPVMQWRPYLLPASILLFVVLTLANDYSSLAPVLGAPHGQVVEVAHYWLLFAISAAAVVVLFRMLYTGEGLERERVRWVVYGFSVALVAQLVDAWIWPTFELYSVRGALQVLTLIVPITVAYAIVRHRIIDVSFIASRAAVYGIMTTALLGTFTMLDWVFSHELSASHVGDTLDIALALVLGFWFNSIERRVDGFVDSVFFRHRHHAQIRLEKTASTLPYAPTYKSIAEFLVTVPVESLVLASGALFGRSQNGGFRRELASGWESNDIRELSAGNALVLQLQASQAPLRVDAIGWRHDRLPPGNASPVLALPILVRGTIRAIALYGAHDNGTDLDIDEERLLSPLAVNAAAAYDHLEVLALQKRIHELERRVHEHEGAVKPGSS